MSKPIQFLLLTLVKGIFINECFQTFQYLIINKTGTRILNLKNLRKTIV